MKLNPDLREFVELLNSRRVEFIVVGAHALAYYGLPRFTKDIDFLVHSETANAERIIEVLAEFGFGSLGLCAADFLEKNQVIQLGRDPHRIDLLTGLSGVDWAECWATKVAGAMDDLPVYFLGKETYVKNKLASGRPQDLADVDRLREISPEGI